MITVYLFIAALILSVIAKSLMTYFIAKLIEWKFNWQWDVCVTQARMDSKKLNFWVIFVVIYALLIFTFQF